MKTIKQFTVRLVNKPGRFAQVLAALSKEKITIHALCVMDSGTRGTLRLVPDDPARTQSALETINVEFDSSDVLFVEVNSQSGGLRRICQRLADEHLNIDYLYGSAGSNGSKTGQFTVIKVNDIAKAQKALQRASSAHTTLPKKRPGRRPVHAR